MSRIKIILALSAVLLSLAVGTAFPASAQSANRSGFLVEAGAGGQFVSGAMFENNSLKINDTHIVPSIYFNIGYLKPLSTYWALEFKAAFNWSVISIGQSYRFKFPFNGYIMDSYTSDFLNYELLPIGFKYSTKDFFKGQSIFCGISTGFGIAHKNSYGIEFNTNYYEFHSISQMHYSFYAPLYLTIGFNFTRHLSIAVIGGYKINITAINEKSDLYEYRYPGPYEYYGSVNLKWKQLGFFGGRVGYRF